MNNHKYFQRLGAFALLIVYTSVFSQDIYKNVRDIRGGITSILRINALTTEQQQIIDFSEIGYYGVLYAHLDNAESKIFFSYNMNRNFAMLDVGDNSNIIDLSRDVGKSDPYRGGYSFLYHHDAEVLYLKWLKVDTTLSDNINQIKEFNAIVDPMTGQNIQEFNPFFKFKNAEFSEDGSRLYAQKIPTNEEKEKKNFYIQIINTQTNKLIESIPYSSISPNASVRLFPCAVKDNMLVRTIFNDGSLKKGYLFVFNIETKEKSKKVQYDGVGEYKLSSDGSKIIISEMNKSNYYRDRSGVIYLIDVIWPEDENDTELLSLNDGIIVQIPPFSTHMNMTRVIHTFNNDPDVFLIYEENSSKPFEDSYLIRISDGAILRGEPYSTGLPVKLINSQGQLLEGGSLKYYEGGWKEAEDYGNGIFSVDTEKETVKLRMSYAYASQDLDNVVVSSDTAVFQTRAVHVHLKNSQGQLIDEGTVKYYAGGWRDFGVTSGGIAIKELLPNSYKFRMSYGFASNDLTQDIEDNSTVVFQAVPVQVELRDSQDQLMDEGTVKYYAGGWRDFGFTSGGVAIKELLPNNYKFRMSYGFASNDLTQDIGDNPIVVFQTVPVQVELRDSQDQLMDEGTVKYYAGGWRDFGVTSGGIAIKELLPNSYKFRMNYAFAANDLTQDVDDNPIVVFQTIPTQVELRDSQNQLIDEGTVKYYASGWREFGITSGGVATKELLPNSYKFRMNYAFASNDLIQDVGENNTIVFQTVLTQVELRDSQDQLMDEGTMKYYAGGWRDFGITSGGVAIKELLPKSYKFRMNYAFATTDLTQNISINSVVQFPTILAEVEVTDQQNQPVDDVEVTYYAGGWRTLGSTSNGRSEKQLLPLSYKFRITYNRQSQDKTQNLTDNPVVEFQIE